MDVMLYEPKIDSKKDVQSMWQLVCGKIQYKTNFPTVNMELLEGGGGGGGREESTFSTTTNMGALCKC